MQITHKIRFNNLQGDIFDGVTAAIVSLPLALAFGVASGAGPIAGLYSLVVIYIASKIRGEISKRLDFPPVLGELVGGVIIGISALHLLVFPESSATASDSAIMTILQWIGNLSPEAFNSVFQSQSEVISILAELGVIVLLFEIGLESDLRELAKVGYQAT
jgi:Kef-type K+ transport system membrane component KefB